MKIKTIKDYYKQLKEQFPEVPEKDIERICSFGWKSLYLHNSYGGDVCISDPNFWCYIGRLKKDSLQYFNYYIRKLSIKMRVLYKRKKIKWDGYYYFALTDNQYKLYLAQKNTRGRRRKNFTFNNLFMYQILDECKICEYAKRYIFRIPYITLIKTKFYVSEIVTDKAELIIERDPLKFEDILIYENEYEFI